MSSIIARLKPNRELIGLFREETRKIANSNSLSIMGHTKWSLGEYTIRDNTKSGLINTTKIQSCYQSKVWIHKVLGIFTHKGYYFISFIVKQKQYINIMPSLKHRYYLP